MTTFVRTYTLNLPVAYPPVVSRPRVTVALGRGLFLKDFPLTFAVALGLVLTTLNVRDFVVRLSRGEALDGERPVGLGRRGLRPDEVAVVVARVGRDADALEAGGAVGRGAPGDRRRAGEHHVADRC
ncbi:hypothetical protein IGS67_06775 [Flavimobilis sp. GY10621]|uniref:Uncharacterized protein n=1 Tax=Flavimobilis rhizosphaerae TaxID=2775421 RepID=A0ABR9DQ03_9MICO|nr:hypothetical protein [Flavimobilis rhizosphaerae]MBD9699195.1 hypothetical protein [Flavimobilis rhizosphaerae]